MNIRELVLLCDGHIEDTYFFLSNTTLAFFIFFHLFGQKLELRVLLNLFKKYNQANGTK